MSFGNSGQILVLFAWRKTASKNPKNSGTICIWSNDATDMLMDLWSAETVQFALENSKTSKETREVYSTLQVSNTFYLIQFDHNMIRLLKDCEVTGLLIDARDKFESQIFLVLFFHCILAYSSISSEHLYINDVVLYF